ncbi:MAG TPA: energy transducer TonB [Novosphingobium sp.]|nr:energy transducer TonB [Novosphingobium sp.]
MTDADLRAPRRTRVGVFVLVALLHVAVFFALLRAFAPDFTAGAVDRVVSVFSVTVTTPPPSSRPSKQPERAGAAAEPGKKAVPREVTAPRPKIVVTKDVAPAAARTGSANTSGARDTGQGSGAGGQGNGSGSGAGGNGPGGGLVAKAQKIAGDINAARDYPRAGRDARIGDYVIIHMTVGVDGRAHNCRVQRASRDPASDALTCRFAEERFRFKPATDVAGNPIASTYGWRQRWFN